MGRSRGRGLARSDFAGHRPERLQLSLTRHSFQIVGGRRRPQPASEPASRASQRVAGGKRASSPERTRGSPRGTPALLDEPDVLEAPIVEDAVVVQDEAFDLRLPAGGSAIVGNDGARKLFGELAFDVPNELLALFLVELTRLRVDHRVHVLVAVLRVVALRLAGIVLVE